MTGRDGMRHPDIGPDHAVIPDHRVAPQNGGIGVDSHPRAHIRMPFPPFDDGAGGIPVIERRISTVQDPTSYV